MFLKRVNATGNQMMNNNDSSMDMYSSSYKPHQGISFMSMMQSSNNTTARGIHKQKKMQSTRSASIISSSSTIKRFVSNTNTSRLLKKNDTVLINVDDEMALLQSVDPQLQGKLGKVIAVRGDEIEVELVNDEDREEDDWDCFAINSPLPKTVNIPSFCVCLEDRVLKTRLTNA
ncbi:hypothetical protein NAEGRDRAFT_79263 [Naegleria gruberi]|uniref:Uncharacterized protein n=1 Tax=Naegleria gruberi TaxID=5762 RepID=D2VB10_NAEGR|nr:uncharacterized protein NAEGRDRAFT_79263 [Naegleria gruberi]EFC46177.1 hypothetical protein NAEGRDRAFT_79263 [Naegleria gruberi]|eukprot:XP_002678921.1 hypothetical protein NAEGRDRAFT_79263 [Naegleria gruberi strain NEG-M]